MDVDGVELGWRWTMREARRNRIGSTYVGEKTPKRLYGGGSSVNLYQSCIKYRFGFVKTFTFTNETPVSTFGTPIGPFDPRCRGTIPSTSEFQTPVTTRRPTPDQGRVQ